MPSAGEGTGRDSSWILLGGASNPFRPIPPRRDTQSALTQPRAGLRPLCQTTGVCLQPVQENQDPPGQPALPGARESWDRREGLLRAGERSLGCPGPFQATSTCTQLAPGAVLTPSGHLPGRSWLPGPCLPPWEGNRVLHVFPPSCSPPPAGSAWVGQNPH